jgi:hypothetical protein
LCFNVIPLTVFSVVVLLSALAVIAALVAFGAMLLRAGFRHGDVAGDVRVRVRTGALARPGAPGRWVQVTLTNPSQATALVALGVRRARWSWLGATPQRHTAGPRTRLSLGERIIGAVPAGEGADFHLWAEGDLRRVRLLVAVGTPGRLRLHRLLAPAPLPGGQPAPGEGRRDPRQPAVS